MTQKWNLQDIRPAESKRRPAPSAPTMQSNHSAHRPPRAERPEITPELHLERERVRERESLPSISIEDGNKKNQRKLWLSVGLFVFIVGGALGLSALLGKTELTIYPEFREPNVSAEFTAFPNKRDDALYYELMTLEATGEAQVKASGQVQMQEQAKGMIEIIKTTPGAERLIKNTRFRTPSGLVYRIQESVVVPGAVKDSSGATVPGTIQAEVFADEIGEEYNVGAGTRFDIPGFQENNLTELYNSIYAENRAPFTGGFDGPQFQIDQNELSTARQALQIQLRDTLLARIETERPADFVAFKDAVTITYNELPAVEYGQDLVTIREQAVLQIPLFQKDVFGAFLTGETVPTYEDGPVRIDNPDVLTFSYSSATTSSSVIANEPSLTFKLTGKPLLIWEYDVEGLKKDLAGLPKTAINNAITAYPGIEGARVRITPFWKRTFPDTAEEIHIIEELREPGE